MSNLPLPEGLSDSQTNRVANQLHSAAIHLLRGARKADTASGLTPERLSILSILVYVGSKTVNQLAEMEQVSAPAITRIVKSLEKDGYIIKAKSRADQRVVFVSATRKSKSLMEEARRDRVENVSAQLKNLSSEQLTQLSDLIRLIG